MSGMSKQLKKLDEGIITGKFSDEVLKEAERVRKGLSNEKDRILNIITQAKNGN
jgi:hypothetical protein